MNHILKRIAFVLILHGPVAVLADVPIDNHLRIQFGIRASKHSSAFSTEESNFAKANDLYLIATDTIMHTVDTVALTYSKTAVGFDGLLLLQLHSKFAFGVSLYTGGVMQGPHGDKSKMLWGFYKVGPAFEITPFSVRRTQFTASIGGGYIGGNLYRLAYIKSKYSGSDPFLDQAHRALPTRGWYAHLRIGAQYHPRGPFYIHANAGYTRSQLSTVDDPFPGYPSESHINDFEIVGGFGLHFGGFDP